MKIKDLIEQLQKLDGEKTIGKYNKKNEVEAIVDIQPPYDGIDINEENVDWLIY